MLLSNSVSQIKLKKKLCFGLLLASVIFVFGCSDLKIQQVSEDINGQLAAVAIGPVDGRDGQLFSRELRRLIYVSGPAEAKYKLESTINYSASSTLSVQGSSSTLQQANMTASIKLFDLASGKLILTDSVSGGATTGTVISLYGQDQSEQHARERLAIMLAQRALQLLRLYFLSQKEKA